MFTTLCVLLGLRVTQPWHIPYVSFHFFPPHHALCHPLRDFESEDKDSASCLGLSWKTLQDILVLKYLPSELSYFYISNHFFRTDNGIFISGGENTCAALLQPLPKLVVTARRPGLSTDPAHRFGLRAIQEPAATSMSQGISNLEQTHPGPGNTRKATRRYFY